MKPQDCGPQYKSKLRECANFAAWTIKKVCKDIGPRPSGSEAELKAEEFMAKQIGKAGDEVTIGVEGGDEDAALAALEAFMKENL